MSFGFSSTAGGATGASGGEQEPRAQPGLDVAVGLALGGLLAVGGRATKHIDKHRYIDINKSTHISISLSLYIYIYIYT